MYIHLYTDFSIHKHICDRSLSGDPLHTVNPFSESMGLSNCDSTHLPNKISARQSVCMSLSDLGFNILPVDSYFDQVLCLFHFPHLACPTPTSFGDY